MTVFEYVMCLEKTAVIIAEQIGADIEKTRIAALLCKADTATKLYKEYPELAGYIGSELYKR
jgi:glycyl-tRNA synthetase beta chain